MANTVEIVDDRGNVQQVPVDRPRFVGDDNQDIQHLRRSESGQAAGAAAAADMLSDFAARPSTVGQQEAALSLLAEIGTPVPMPRIGQEQPAAAEEPQSPAAEETVAPLTIPDDYELPADLAAELDEPDEPEATALAGEPEEIPPVWDDDEVAADPRLEQARAQAQAAEKRAEHERKLRVDAQKPAWKDEAKRVFRLGEVELVSDEELAEIDASSHREFLRKAKDLADRNKVVARRFAPQAAAVPAPAPAEAAAGPFDADAERARIREEERQRLEREQWGSPTTGGQQPETLPLDAQRRLERARQQGNLKDIFRNRLFGNS